MENWLADLNAPPRGADPDKVSDEVIEEEMALFRALKAQTG